MTYEVKFKGLIEAIENARAERVSLMISDPRSLGDNYNELIESLNRIAIARVTLQIIPPKIDSRN